MTEYERVGVEIHGDDGEVGGAPLGLRPLEELSEDERAKLEARGAPYDLSPDAVRTADAAGWDLGRYAAMLKVRNVHDFERLRAQEDLVRRAEEQARFERAVEVAKKS